MNSVVPVIDGHNDILTRLYFRRQTPESFFDRRSDTHLDFIRAQEGGFAGGFFAFMARGRGRRAGMSNIGQGKTWSVDLAPGVDARSAQRKALEVASFLFKIEKASDGQLRVVDNADDLSWAVENRGVAAILHFEGAEPIDRDLNSLEFFYRAGLRSLGLVWSRPNDFGHGVPFRFPHSPDIGPGLTAPGKELVSACNELGIMIDLSHLNEKGFWDVANISRAPLVASHSNAHALCPITRNLTDDQLEAIKDSDGLVGVNYSVAMLREDGSREPNTPLTEIVRHVDYLVTKVGIDRVALGSDFDGTTIPSDMGDVAGLPKLIDALTSAGYAPGDVEKIAHQNWLRVLRRTWIGRMSRP